MHLKGNWYYLVTSAHGKREWIKLAPRTDKPLALRKWGEMAGREPNPDDCLFSDAVKRYRRDVLPNKAPRTQRDNEKEIEVLLPVFGHMPLDDIAPADVRNFLIERGKTAKTRANREKALLSHVFNKAREWGYTDAPNPCAGVAGFKESPRDRYIEDAEFKLIIDHADAVLRDAMEIAYYTGQRPADVLKLERSDIRDGLLWVAQNKTGKRLRIRIEGGLKEAIDRALARERTATGRRIVQNEGGQPLTFWQLRGRFDRARKAAAKALLERGQDDEARAIETAQFRDIRAKAASDLEDTDRAQRLLGHKHSATTDRYVRARAGDIVKPVGRKL